MEKRQVLSAEMEMGILKTECAVRHPSRRMAATEDVATAMTSLLRVRRKSSIVLSTNVLPVTPGASKKKRRADFVGAEDEAAVLEDPLSIEKSNTPRIMAPTISSMAWG